MTRPPVHSYIKLSRAYAFWTSNLKSMIAWRKKSNFILECWEVLRVWMKMICIKSLGKLCVSDHRWPGRVVCKRRCAKKNNTDRLRSSLVIFPGELVFVRLCNRKLLTVAKMKHRWPWMLTWTSLNLLRELRDFVKKSPP